jgi:hypothetical protein
VKRRVHYSRRLDGKIAIEGCGDDPTVGTVTPLREGVPLVPGKPIVKLTPDSDGVHADLETVYEGERSGPAQVATEQYRRGWTETFTN